MRWSQKWAARRHRAVWTDPDRKLRTLESFAETEDDGGKDLVAAAKRVADPDLRMHLLRHADDEQRHAQLFRNRAADMRAKFGRSADGLEGPDKPYDLSRGRKGLEVDAHGFFNAGLFDEMGEVAYVAMLHVAEQRAADLFEVHLAASNDDPEMTEVFTEILKDEKYHVAYTGRFLDRWRKDGRDREVSEALKSARSSRFLGAWKRLGLRSGAGFSKAVLYVLYWTILAPFGLLTRKSFAESSWREPRAAGNVDSQY